MSISADLYKQIGQAAAGAVSVVAARDSLTDTIVALTASSFVTLSFSPPLVMFAIQQDADSYRPIVTSRTFGVSLLNVRQAEVARRFATKGLLKTVGISFEEGLVMPVPLIPESLAQIECLTNQIFVSGDHAIVVGLVEAARTYEKDPLLYFRRQYGLFSPLSPTHD